jgi:hypothetical protein
MKSYTALPAGYREIFNIDLNKNKKAAVFINVLAVIILLAMVFPMLPVRPFSILSCIEMASFVRPVVFIGGLVLYLVLHEAVHGFFMWIFSKQKPHFGIKGIYAYAGSNAFFSKAHYLIIGLSPIIIWGIVLTILCFAVPDEWFWYVYLIQVMNISGAAGDIYVSVKFCRMPSDILVQDSGTAMTVYSFSDAQKSL